MSIEVATRIKSPVKLRVFLPRIANVLRNMLNVNTQPVFTLDVLSEGKRSLAESDELRDRSTPYFLLSIQGEPETVGLWTDGEDLCVTMAAQRTKLEYALGAAVAITMAQEFGGRIEDDRRCFGMSDAHSAEDMFENLRVRSKPPISSLRDASDLMLFGDERRRSDPEAGDTMITPEWSNWQD